MTMEVGRHTYGHEQITVRSWGEPAELRIGSFCSIADRVTVFLGGNHRSDARGLEGEHTTNGDVTIGNDVWIGSNATIMSGVTVGDGAVIGADSCLTRDVAAYAMVAGNPARQLRLRFDPETIEKLLSIRWWEWSEERIEANVPLLCNTDIDRFLRAQETAGSLRSAWKRLLGSRR